MSSSLSPVPALPPGMGPPRLPAPGLSRPTWLHSTQSLGVQVQKWVSPGHRPVRTVNSPTQGSLWSGALQDASGTFCSAFSRQGPAHTVSAINLMQEEGVWGGRGEDGEREKEGQKDLPNSHA